MSAMRRERSICPCCGRPATVTWLGVEIGGNPLPMREDIVSLDCANGCRFTLQQLSESFPPTCAQPDRSQEHWAQRIVPAD